MADDLADIYASVEWAIAQLDIFEDRLARWFKDSPCAGVFDAENSESGNETLKIQIVKPAPRILNVDAGLIIHAIRSSLDHLAVKLAERNGSRGRKDVYFPVCDIITEWTKPKHGGLKKIKRLSPADQAVIEKFQPYNGGDNGRLLSCLHQMDIARKHRELLKFKAIYPGIGVYRLGSLPPEFDAIIRAQAPEDGYSLAAMPSNPDYQVQVRIEVTLDDPRLVNVQPAIGTFREFIRLAYAIIDMFDN